jgi:LDH2 family malate/lactate/ureidoglycolate dehydrogenase
MNRVKNHRLTEEPLPDNTARDVNGDLTNDPFEAVSLEPIGSHKGFALAFLIEILTSGLTGMGHSTSVLKMYGSDLTLHRGVSHTFILIDPKALPGGVDGVKSVIDISRSYLMPEQRSVSPGIKEMNTFAERMKKGIPVDETIINEWRELGFNEN